MTTLGIIVGILAGLFIAFALICFRSPRGEENDSGFHPDPSTPADKPRNFESGDGVQSPGKGLRKGRIQ